MKKATLTLIFALLVTDSAWAQGVLVGVVTRVWDGDTLELQAEGRDAYRIRLAGIDAPERGQPWWRVSTDWLKRTARGRVVTVEWSTHDRYGRVLGVVRLGGEDLNLTLVCRGWAWHYVAYADQQSAENRAAYAACEKHARDERAGLWAEAAPVAPWDWRRRVKRGGVKRRE